MRPLRYLNGRTPSPVPAEAEHYRTPTGSTGSSRVICNAINLAVVARSSASAIRWILLVIVVQAEQRLGTFQITQTSHLLAGRGIAEIRGNAIAISEGKKLARSVVARWR